jgi:hypothetical protein
MATDITKHGITATFSGTVAYGEYDAVPGWAMWVEAGAVLTGHSPAPTGTGATRRNGAMKNHANHLKQGYDGRCTDLERQGYDASLDVSLSYPLTLAAGDCVIISKSGNLSYPDLTPGPGVPSNLGMIEDYLIIHCVASPPATGTFAPCPWGTVRDIYTIADIVGTLPYLTATNDPVGTGTGYFELDDAKWLVGPQYHLIGGTSYAMDRMATMSSMENYPANRAKIVHALGILAASDHSRATEAAYRVIQDGIWQAGALEASGTTGLFSAGAGYGAGHFFPVLFAGYMLGDTAMLAYLTAPWEDAGGTWDYGATDYLGYPVGAFWESTTPYLSETAWSGYAMPRETYPDGKPLYGDARNGPGVASNDSRRDPDLVYDAVSDAYTLYGVGLPDEDGWGDYMHLACKAFVGGFIAARLIGIDSYYPVAAQELGYRWINDYQMWSADTDYRTSLYYKDIYGFGGWGNGFNYNMWAAYGTMADYAVTPPVDPIVPDVTVTGGTLTVNVTI